MKLQFLHPVAFVKDINVSRQFYTGVLGLKIIEEHEVYILFEMHFSIHQAQALNKTVFGFETDEALKHQGKNNILFYFETDDLEGMFLKIHDKIDLIHPIERQAWGQRVFRFKDPDGHIIEIGEPLPNYADWASYSGKYFGMQDSSKN